MYTMQFSTMTNTKTHQVSVRNIIVSNKSKKELSVFWGDKKEGVHRSVSGQSLQTRLEAQSHMCALLSKY